MKKVVSGIAALGLVLTLGACGNDDNGATVERPTPDTVTHATSSGGATAEEMRVALGAEGDERAWVFGLRDDITYDGELRIEGYALKHSGGEWLEDVYERKVGLYQRAEVAGQARVPVGTFTLTVTDGIYVDSPNTFFISDGPFVAEVNADVFVNTPGFRLNGVQINGNVTFASQELLDSAVAFAWDSDQADIREGEDDEFVLYASNSGWSEVPFDSLVTGTVTVQH